MGSQQRDGSGTWNWSEDGEEPMSSGSNARGADVPSSKEEFAWRWQGQPVQTSGIDDDKKKQALVACADLHVELVGCLKQGMFADCGEQKKAFWDCYTKHRGARGNKIAAWFAPPNFSNSKK